MSRLADEVGRLVAAAGNARWFWNSYDAIFSTEQEDDGTPTRLVLGVTHDDSGDDMQSPHDRAVAALAAAFGSPDRAEAAVEALEKIQAAILKLHPDIYHDVAVWDAMQNVEAVIRSWELAQAIAE